MPRPELLLPFCDSAQVAWTKGDMETAVHSGSDYFWRRAQVEYRGRGGSLLEFLQIAQRVTVQAAGTLHSEHILPDVDDIDSWGLAQPPPLPPLERYTPHPLLPAGLALIVRVPVIQPAALLSRPQRQEMAVRIDGYYAEQRAPGELYHADIWPSQFVVADPEVPLAKTVTTMVDADPKISIAGH